MTGQVTTGRIDGVELPAETRSFLFVDVDLAAGEAEQLGPGYVDFFSTYRSLVTSAAESHRGGLVAAEGHRLLCVFGSAVDAAESAVQIQVAMSKADWPGGIDPRGRIGIHTGDAVQTDVGYVGADVLRAARIAAAAQDGQILVSATTRALVRDHAGRRGWGLVDLGSYDIEGLERPEPLVRLDPPGEDPVVLPPRARAHAAASLPTEGLPIVGRVDDIAGVSEMLMRDAVRLVTVTGPGGTGKTRLAVEVARRLQSRFPDGVVFVDLSSVTEPRQFVASLGRALGVRDSAERGVIERLGNLIGSRRMLLVLDNMEQLVEAAGDVVALLATLPDVHILVTSRAPLRVTPEHEYPLAPLPVPPGDADVARIAETDAVALFVARAEAARPDFALDGQNAPIVAEITRRLDGLPLAIELAAARLRALSPESLLAHLDDRLGLLDRGPRDSPERHRTLRAAIRWSYDLLTEREQALFRRLGVFSGGWSLSAAAAVGADPGEEEMDILDLLGELAAQSLLVFSSDQFGQPRYQLLQTVRDFALGELAASGEEDDARRRHFAWCMDLTGRIEQVLPTPMFPPLLDEIDQERFNIREALAWSLAANQLLEEASTLCGYLPLYWDIRGYVLEGLKWGEELLARAESRGTTPGRALALGAVGWLSMLAGRQERSEEALVRADGMWREIGDRRWLARSLSMHGMTTYNLGRLETAEAQFHEAIELARETGLDWLADAWCAYGLAHIALDRGDFEVAHRLLEQALAFSRARSLAWGVGHINLSLAVLAMMGGDVPEAIERLGESLSVRRELKDTRGIGDCLGLAAVFASMGGDHRMAAVLLGAASVTRAASGHSPVPWQRPMLEEAETGARRSLGDGYEAAFEEGRRLGTDEAIERAMRLPRPVAPGTG